MSNSMDSIPVDSEKFKIGDYIFADLHSTREPYWICKIEEIQKQSNSDVQIKVKLFFRRRHVSQDLLVVADKYTDSFLHNEEFDWDLAEEPTYNPSYVKLHYKLLQRNLFVSKENVIITADMIKGKCYVFLLTMVDSPMDVLTNDNKFFFLLAYDISNQEVHEDKGSIMIGNSYQAELPVCKGTSDTDIDKPRDQLIWEPDKCSDKTYSQLNSVVRSVQAFKNLAKTNPKTRPMQVHRDIHLFGAMEILNRENYDLNSAGLSIVQDQSLTCDVIDSWNRDEVMIFERALYKYGKQFHYIRQEFLPWKSWENIISFYYQWKGTRGYKLWKQEYYSDQGDLKEIEIVVKEWLLPPLTGCETTSSKCPGCGKVPKLPDCWFSWGPVASPVRICKTCALYWKRFAGFPDSPALECKVWESSSPSVIELPHSKLFKCEADGCSKAFKCKSGLRRHQLLCHDNPCRGQLFLCTEGTLASRKCLGIKTIRHIARRPCQAARIK